MQEVALSNDLKQIEFEIKQYEKQTGENLLEIGRRINWVKQNNLDHGEFLPFLERINISKSYAEMFMKVAKDHEIGNSQPDGNLGITVLYELTKIPNEMRNEPQQLDSGESKKPVDMTRREIQELNRKLKQSEDARKTLGDVINEKSQTINALEEQVKNKPAPEIVEKEIEKVPEDYEQLKLQAQTVGNLQSRNNELQKQIDDLNSKLSEMNAKGQEYEELQEKIDKLEKQRSNVRQSIDAGSNIMLLNDQLKELFDTKLSALRYKNFFADDPMTSTVKETEDLLDTLQGFIDDMRHILPQHDRKIIEGKFSE